MGLWARVNFIQHVLYPGVFSPIRPDETASELWFFGAGEDGKNCKNSFKYFITNAIQLWTFVGKEKETEISSDPNEKLAIEYRKFIRRVVKKIIGL